MGQYTHAIPVDSANVFPYPGQFIFILRLSYQGNARLLKLSIFARPKNMESIWTAQLLAGFCVQKKRALVAICTDS
jgi:hypothetical protein